MTSHNKSVLIGRRDALRAIGSGFGMMAFSALGSSIARAEDTSLSVTGGILKELHHKPRAKRVIFMFLNGGCSSIDTFDYKPSLVKYDGKPLPGGGTKTERKTGNLMKSPFSWKQYGQTGKWVSEIFPSLSERVDDHVLHSFHRFRYSESRALDSDDAYGTQSDWPPLGRLLDYLWSRKRK